MIRVWVLLDEALDPAHRRKTLSKLARIARRGGQQLTRHRSGGGWRLGLHFPKQYPSDTFRPPKAARAASLYSKRRYRPDSSRRVIGKN